MSASVSVSARFHNNRAGQPHSQAWDMFLGKVRAASYHFFGVTEVTGNAGAGTDCGF